MQENDQFDMQRLGVLTVSTNYCFESQINKQIKDIYWNLKSFIWHRFEYILWIFSAVIGVHRILYSGIRSVNAAYSAKNSIRRNPKPLIINHVYNVYTAYITS